MMPQTTNDVIDPSRATGETRPTPTRRTPVTIKDVARASQVSIGTVSNVLNGRESLVRAETRERVLEAARQMNFQPSAAARNLAQGRTRTLGVLFHTSANAIVSDPYASTILQGILTTAATAGYGILLYPEPWQNAEQEPRLFASRRTDGILAIAPDIETIPDLIALGSPLALVSVCYRPDEIGRQNGDGVIACAVDIDNAAGGRIAVEHLIALGHRKIAHLAGDTHQSSAHEREAGWRDALAAAGLEALPEYRILCDYQGDTGYAATQNLLALPDPPTAIFAANDRLAFASLRAARDSGVAVPDQLSVIGFDDISAASLVTPSLTTIRQPLIEIGGTAVKALIALLDDEPAERSAPPTDCLLFSPTLVERGSTAAAPPTRAAPFLSSRSLPPAVSVIDTEGIQK